jgi:PAS domain S-box-containing protein
MDATTDATVAQPGAALSIAQSAVGLHPDMVELILDNVADGVFTVDADFHITFFNAAAERITGFSCGEATGRPCFEVFRTPLCGDECPLRRSVHTRESTADFELDILTRTRRRQTVSVSTAPLINPNGEFVGGVETFRDLSALQELRRSLRQQYTFEDLVAKSEPMRRIADALPKIAHSLAPVLLYGAAGVGKELIATAIHNVSARKRGPFVRVGCSTLPELLLEAELFGSPTRAGRLDAARGGTLFLADVADVPMRLQARLLRALEAVDDPHAARVVAGTRHDLARRAREGGFLEELYRRLSVVALRLPALRDRAPDLPQLVQRIVDRLQLRMGRNISGVSDAALAALLRYPFPGNVRELENALEHAYIVATGSHIVPGDLPAYVLGPSRASGGVAPPGDPERVDLLACLERNHWSVPRAARELGVHRTTLWRRLKRLGIERPS